MENNGELTLRPPNRSFNELPRQLAAWCALPRPRLGAGKVKSKTVSLLTVVFGVPAKEVES